jgi:hypothetical protein
MATSLLGSQTAPGSLCWDLPALSYVERSLTAPSQFVVDCNARAWDLLHPPLMGLTSLKFLGEGAQKFSGGTMPADKKSEQVVIRLSPEQYDQLKSRAQDEERSVAQIVRFALRQYFDAPPALAL